MKINFKEFSVFLDVEQKTESQFDIRKQFANMLYQQGAGIECLDLAMKIYKSEGELEYTEQECELIRSYAAKCTPVIINAMNRLFNKNKEENE